MSDQLQRFIFSNTDVRGLVVQLDESYRLALAHHHYAPPVTALLGEFLAAVSLLGAILKFDGRLTLQARSERQIPTIMAEMTSDGQLRCIARGAQQAISADFEQLLGGGQLAITIEPDNGPRYQGIVALQGEHLAPCIEAYFAQSEQLPTRLWLAADGQRAGGLLLQELPARSVSDDQRREQWRHLEQLAATVRPEELLQLDAPTLLYRLYHQETVRLLARESLRFGCSCSRARCEAALAAVGRAEAESVIAERGSIQMVCEFCNRQYLFDQGDIYRLFVTRH